MVTIPQILTLDDAIEISDELEGIALQTLEAYDTIHVRTNHSDYDLLLLDPKSGRALVRGGRRFVEPVEVTVNGSTFGGCMLKSGWLGVGLRMEVDADGHSILTSPVQSLHVTHPGLNHATED